MCGIVGYSGGKNCVGIIMEGLKKLEYRGYDSAGIAFEETQGLDVLKAVGRVENLEKLVKSRKVKSNCAIAHTRWATFGCQRIRQGSAFPYGEMRAHLGSGR